MDEREVHVGLTYLMSGRMVIDQKMALRPPITSSSEGTGPEPGQIPFKTYLETKFSYELRMQTSLWGDSLQRTGPNI